MGRSNLISGFSSVANIGTGLVTVSAYGASKASGVNLGLSEGGINIEPSAKAYDVKVDNARGVVARFPTDEACKVTFNIAEASLSNLALELGYPAASVAGGVFSFGGAWNLPQYTVYIDVNGPGGGTREYKIQMCNIIGDAKHAYKKGALTVIPITIECMEDLTQTIGERVFTVTDSGASVTAPTIVMTTPAPAGTVTKNTKGTILFTITDTLAVDQSSVVYGSSVLIQKITNPAAPALIAGTIAIDPVANTITFTPTVNWVASDALLIIVSTELMDVAGNRLAAPYITNCTVTA